MCAHHEREGRDFFAHLVRIRVLELQDNADAEEEGAGRETLRCAHDRMPYHWLEIARVCILPNLNSFASERYGADFIKCGLGFSRLLVHFRFIGDALALGIALAVPETLDVGLAPELALHGRAQRLVHDPLRICDVIELLAHVGLAAEVLVHGQLGQSAMTLQDAHLGCTQDSVHVIFVLVQREVELALGGGEGCRPSSVAQTRFLDIVVAVVPLRVEVELICCECICVHVEQTRHVRLLVGRAGLQVDVCANAKELGVDRPALEPLVEDLAVTAGDCAPNRTRRVFTEDSLIILSPELPVVRFLAFLLPYAPATVWGTLVTGGTLLRSRGLWREIGWHRAL
mmetsp:Transcript_3770/g.10632  ORF Transcript_3770/g.10632 Transcript_3770/m.10632 type:complete len:342 (-) Transcript_3770:165-1190(-)